MEQPVLPKLLTIFSVLCVLALAACSNTGPASGNSQETATGKPADTTNGGVVLHLEGAIHADLPDYSFDLIGAKPESASAPAHVLAIEIRRGDQSPPFQTISGIQAQTPLEHPGAFELLDMNFDGYRDLRLIESAPAGPNVPYRNWLFDRSSGEFESSPELDQITSPVFDPAAKTIRSAWRDGPARYGEDTYQYSGEHPVLVRREERRYSAPGVYRLTISERSNGELQVTESREIRE